MARRNPRLRDHDQAPTRLVRFSCAMSLDGYIAGAHGEYDWIAMDPEIDFANVWAGVDTFLFGRKTFEAMVRMGSDGKAAPETRNIVCSRTVRAADYPHVTVSTDAESIVTELRGQRGKDIAIFGGGELFRSLLAAGLVDRLEVGLVPVLLGGGVPLLPPPAERTILRLRKQRAYKKTGTVGLEYDIVRAQY